MGTSIVLSRCPELHRLELHTLTPGEAERATISSIISTNIRTITFKRQWANFRPHIKLSERFWLPLDDAMCGLVNKLGALGYEHALEVVIHFDPDVDCGRFMQKFRDKGRVTIGYPTY